tara:strand:+ start:796 stop:972 length:177 start_codon:yes stop_codon:yes gene_type:complete
MKNDHVDPLFQGIMNAISGQMDFVSKRVTLKLSDEAHEKHKAEKRRVKAINPKRHINR